MSGRLITRSCTSRRGSILIMVMAVLLITGLIASQTIELLWTTSKNDRQRERLLQAREMVELGKIMLEQGVVPEGGAAAVEVDGVPGKITFQSLNGAENASSAETRRFRIVAEYGGGNGNRAVATWETGQ